MARLVSDGTKADDIALALEEAIVSGEIPPGSRRSRPRSPEGARVLAREHVLSSGRLLEAILDKVSAQARETSPVAEPMVY
jgi:hypothetical protein